ncbi:ATP-binding protein [Saccharothrix coeruleofusca]|uniref:HTH cro/C1-type domain-containing protein n=1 Tax=Saccharothrix coeruleofusca TaxID=33919 RepID=A0A918EG68_9PSEU|nr:NB-ARC domain-containing protein [Saccharothrix coeruleofusca]MBP2337195.1 tetratricopeptide (TPR) repeat protein/transcriptional regulator with XRE-family HTH domain [Saccharothrix coeruleofusca]GGP66500.1 hypothetical protein GCM10010185_44030 [Saccharothrix coeruleofusca]
MDDRTDTPSQFGELLLRHRRAAGLSQRALSRLSGVSERALRELERGRARAAQRRSAEVLADALGLAGDARAEFLAVAREGRRRTARETAAGAAELPPLPPDLVGREAELLRLRDLVSAHPAVAIVGQPGVGKTVLATFAAQQMRDQFPDGCFAVDLRGVDEQPLPTRAVFERLLRALEVPQNEIPATEAEQSGVYRAVLSRRKALILLDNAANEAQVRPLLTAAPGCRTLITCRRTLAGLEGVRWLQLGPLADSDATALLLSIVGGRVRAAPGEAAELAALCGNLPLALRIAGKRLATMPHWSLDYLAGQLRDERIRLTSLSAVDLQVRSAFEVSYRRLSPGGRTAFRRLAAVPGEDFGVDLARVATGMTARQTHAHLDELVDASMVLLCGEQGRFRFHDLIRIFARERWEAEHDQAERDRVTETVLRHLLSTACAAGAVFFPDGARSDEFASLDQARTWLEQEAANWLAAVREAARRGWHREVLELAKSMHWYSDDHWFTVPWEEVFGAGVAAARELGDRSSEAQQLNFVGWAVRREIPALAAHEQALRVAVAAGDELEQVWALGYCGSIYAKLGDGERAREALRRAVALSARFDFWTVQLPVRHRYGRLLLRLGEAGEALTVMLDLLAQAEANSAGELPLPRRRLVVILIEGVALCLHGMGQCEQAADMFTRAGAAYVENGSKMLEAYAALREGRCRIDAGDHERAAAVLGRALALYAELAMPEEHAQVEAELARLPGSGGREAPATGFR